MRECGRLGWRSGVCAKRSACSTADGSGGGLPQGGRARRAGDRGVEVESTRPCVTRAPYVFYQRGGLSGRRVVCAGAGLAAARLQRRLRRSPEHVEGGAAARLRAGGRGRRSRPRIQSRIEGACARRCRFAIASLSARMAARPSTSLPWSARSRAATWLAPEGRRRRRPIFRHRDSNPGRSGEGRVS